VGAPIHGAHTPGEKVNKKDVKSMIELYKKLFEALD
jgi:acetylornithine deacetylase/succinyl-diaminopimelate desuccinylase-like protein